MSQLTISRRISLRSSLVLLAATVGLAASSSVAVLAGLGQLRGTWLLAAIALAVSSVLVLGVFAITWAEVHRVAEREQVAAARRMTLLLSNEPVRTDLLQSLSLDILSPGASTRESTQVEVFLRTALQNDFRLTLVSGPVGAGKSTLLRRLAAKTASQTAAGSGSHWPLFVSAGSWRIGDNLSDWVESEMASYFRVRRRVTNAWMHSGASVLFVDGLDEVQSEHLCGDLFDRLHDWQRRPSGGKIVVSVRPDQSRLAAKYHVDRIVALRPIDIERAEEVWRSLVRHADFLDGMSRRDSSRWQRQFFSELLRLEGATPSVLWAVEQAVLSSRNDALFAAKVGAEDAAAQTDPDSSAVVAYKQIAQDAEPSVAAVALVRASILEAGMGEQAQAVTTFEKALDLFEELNPLRAKSPISVLSEAEREVLRALDGGRPLLEEEIVARTTLLPSNANNVLRSLITKGFIFVREIGHPRVTFYESAINLRADALDTPTPESI